MNEPIKLSKSRVRRKKLEQLTPEQVDALSETAFIVGQFFMEGLIYAINKHKQRLDQEREDNI
jgi:hypothetical protein